MSEPARLAATSTLGVRATLRRGIAVSPELVAGMPVSLAIAVVAAVTRVLVPIAVQQAIDTGILAEGGPDPRRVAVLALVALVGLLGGVACQAYANVRLFRSSERGLATLRTRAFRHVHDLSVLTQGTERRGSLVSRVTSDVDTISLFVQWGGVMLLVSALQLTVATVVMAVYSWQLTLLAWACFIPLFLAVPRMQRVVNRRYAAVRERTGRMLGALSESVVGAETVRAYGIEDRTRRRIEAAVESTRAGSVAAQTMVASAFSIGVFVANGVLAVVVVVGALLGLDGQITVGKLLAFLFLVQLFTTPVQQATEVLNELQNAVAGWRRVLGVLETPIDVPAPAPHAAARSPRGAAHLEFRAVSFGYPDGPPVLESVDLDVPAGTQVAVVGATGSGKTTMARLAARFVDPGAGLVLLDGVDLRTLDLDHLRRRVVYVPQEGFLFDGTIGENLAYGLRDGGPDDPRIRAAVDELGLGPWVDELPAGMDTAVGQRGERLSAGERQLVALVRARLADGDLLLLDEATSAVDPATEVRIARALAGLTGGRTTVTIAHRLSTAEAADLVVVLEAGRIVELGHHRDLVGRDGVYGRLHAAWVASSAG